MSTISEQKSTDRNTGILEGTKVCAKCGHPRQLSEFRRHAKARDGRHSWCKPCHRAHDANYRARNRDSLLAYKQRWHRTREVEIDTKVIANGRRNARNRGCTVIGFSRRDWEALKAAFQGRCAYCGAKTKVGIDHVVPLSRHGEHNISNIVPCCVDCNTKKNAKLPLSFAILIPAAVIQAELAGIEAGQ